MFAVAHYWPKETCATWQQPLSCSHCTAGNQQCSKVTKIPLSVLLRFEQLPWLCICAQVQLRVLTNPKNPKPACMQRAMQAWYTCVCYFLQESCDRQRHLGDRENSMDRPAAIPGMPPVSQPSVASHSQQQATGTHLCASSLITYKLATGLDATFACKFDWIRRGCMDSVANIWNRESTCKQEVRFHPECQCLPFPADMLGLSAARWPYSDTHSMTNKPRQQQQMVDNDTLTEPTNCPPATCWARERFVCSNSVIVSSATV